MTVVDNQALIVGHRLACLLFALDPEPSTPALILFPIRTSDGLSAWNLGLSEVAVEGFARLLDAMEELQWSARRPARPALHVLPGGAS